MHTDTEQTDSLEQRVRDLVLEVIDGTALFLVDLDVRGRKGSRVVDVFLDSDDELGIDTLAEISRELSFLLDAEDFIKGRYNLNVSSPGVDRPLVLPRQYSKNIGRTLEVQYQPEDAEAPLQVQGELVGADDETIKIEVDGKTTDRIRYQDITQAKVLLPW